MAYAITARQIEAARRVGIGEDRIDECEHGARGAERAVERNLPEDACGRFGTVGDTRAGGDEGAWIGALEGEDRLLDVTHGKHRAHLVARALAGEELRRQGLDDAPLRAVGVLRLVDQHMVDAVIELVENPGRDIRPRQERLGAGDEVVIIEHTGMRLRPLISMQDRLADAHRRGGELGRAGEAQALPDGRHARDLGGDHVRRPGPGRSHRLRGIARAGLARLAPGGEKGLAIVGPERRARRRFRGAECVEI